MFLYVSIFGLLQNALVWPQAPVSGFSDLSVEVTSSLACETEVVIFDNMDSIRSEYPASGTLGLLSASNEADDVEIEWYSFSPVFFMLKNLELYCSAA